MRRFGVRALVGRSPGRCVERAATKDGGPVRGTACATGTGLRRDKRRFTTTVVVVASSVAAGSRSHLLSVLLSPPPGVVRNESCTEFEEPCGCCGSRSSVSADGMEEKRGGDAIAAAAPRGRACCGDRATGPRGRARRQWALRRRRADRVSGVHESVLQPYTLTAALAGWRESRRGSVLYPRGPARRSTVARSPSRNLELSGGTIPGALLRVPTIAAPRPTRDARRSSSDVAVVSAVEQRARWARVCRRSLRHDLRAGETTR